MAKRRGRRGPTRSLRKTHRPCPAWAKNALCRAVEKLAKAPHTAFAEALEPKHFPKPHRAFEFETAMERVRRLASYLWGCGESLPDATCDVLGLARGSTFAKAVRRLAAESDSGAPPAAEIDHSILADPVDPRTAT